MILLKKLSILTILFLVTILPISDLTAQRLFHVQGDIMVAVEKDYTIAHIHRSLSQYPHGLPNYTVEQVAAEPMNVWLIKVDHALVNEDLLLNFMLNSSEVLYAQRNHITTQRVTPDDPFFFEQWQYINDGSNNGVEGADIDMDLAWDITTGGLTAHGDTIVVCIVDDGVDPTHQDLQDNLWKNYSEIPSNGIDDDGNGYVDDYLGWDVYNDTDNIYQDGSHGTAVAGIVGAKGNNELGVAGVNWDIKLMIVRGGSPESNAIASYSYAYTQRKRYNETDGQEGAFVVATNSSWGVDFGMASDAPLWCAFYDTLGTQGILNFGATINGNTNVDEAGDLPTTCGSDYMVAVTNMNRRDEKVTGAGYGATHIDLGAFGAQTYTTDIGNTYGPFGGTSGATPHVAGVAALVYATECDALINEAKTNPAGAALAVRQFILQGVDPNESLQGITTTGGRLNARKSLDIVLNSCADCPFPLSVATVESNPTSITLEWTSIVDANSGYLIRYRLSGDSQWTEETITQSTHTIIGLEPCATYEMQVKSLCQTTESDWSFLSTIATEGCCVMPSELIINTTTDEITIEWSDIEYTSDYIVQYRVVGDEEWIAAMTLDSEYVLSNIEPCTSIEIRVSSRCSEFGSVSEYTETYTVTSICGSCTETGYCMFGSKDSEFEWIDSISIADLQFRSGSNQGGYGNYLGGETTTLTQGSTVDVFLQPGFEGSTYDEYFTVWIDWNQDQIFDEDTEIAFDAMEPSSDPTTGQFTVPVDAVVGITRLRIVMRFEDRNGPCDPGTSYRYGEIEDYCVEIIAADCGQDPDIMIVDSTDQTITIKWLQNPTVESITLEFKEENSAMWSDEIIITDEDSNEYTFANLTECTTYDYRYREFCQNEFGEYYQGIMKTKCVNSVNDLSDAFDIEVLVNPVHDLIAIDIHSSGNHTLRAVLYDNTGQKILERSRKVLSGTQSWFMDVEALQSGLYILKIDNGQSQKTFKLVVL